LYIHSRLNLLTPLDPDTDSSTRPDSSFSADDLQKRLHQVSSSPARSPSAQLGAKILEEREDVEVVRQKSSDGAWNVGETSEFKEMDRSEFKEEVPDNVRLTFKYI